MIGYIYQIKNNINNKIYIGQTIRLEERRRKHFQQLKNNCHINYLLQKDWNKYGEENFSFSYEEFEITKRQDLNPIESEYIKKADSYRNGYNLTMGGDGGDTRSKLNYEQYCLIYLGCQWKGYTLKLGKYFGVDSSCISSILRGKSYLFFKDQADKESTAIKEKYVSDFRELFSISPDIPFDANRNSSQLTEDEYFYCLCVASSYGRGIEQALANYFDKHKSFLSNGVKSAKKQGKVYDAKQRFLQLTVPEIQSIGREKFEEWQLQDFSKTTLKYQFNDKWRQ